MLRTQQSKTREKNHKKVIFIVYIKGLSGGDITNFFFRNYLDLALFIKNKANMYVEMVGVRCVKIHLQSSYYTREEEVTYAFTLSVYG